MLRDASAGYAVKVLACGQTGSGNTYTICQVIFSFKVQMWLASPTPAPFPTPCTRPYVACFNHSGLYLCACTPMQRHPQSPHPTPAHTGMEAACPTHSDHVRPPPWPPTLSFPTPPSPPFQVRTLLASMTLAPSCRQPTTDRKGSSHERSLICACLYWGVGEGTGRGRR